MVAGRVQHYFADQDIDHADTDFEPRIRACRGHTTKRILCRSTPANQTRSAKYLRSRVHDQQAAVFCPVDRYEPDL